MHRTFRMSLTLLVSLSLAAPSVPAEPEPEADIAVAAPKRPAADYADPARRVDIGAGRMLNLRCSGQGAPTVVLEAGFGADSFAWWRVQPMLQARQRVCSYDRAGYGFSDAGPLPRDVEAEVEDLHALIHAAGIATPVILVGHSFGANIARRYDQRYGEDVAALVLVEPPPQNIGAFSESYVRKEAHLLPIALRQLQRCEQGARDDALAKPTGELRQCLRPPDPRFGQRINDAIRANQSKPAFWQTLVSGSEAKAALFTAPVAADERHGDKPLLVLTARRAYASGGESVRGALQSAQITTHETLAGTSSRGQRVIVNRSSHEVPQDRPDAIVDAVGAATRALAGGTSP